MIESFQQRYISREQHQEIIDYYKKWVLKLRRDMSELRTQVDSQNIERLVEHGNRLTERELRRSNPIVHGGNVISLDFQRGR